MAKRETKLKDKKQARTKSIVKSFGKQMYKYRTAQNIDAQSLANSLKKPVSAIYEYENSKKEPRYLQDLIDISHELNCSVDDLLGIKPPKEQNNADIVDRTGLSPLAVGTLVNYAATDNSDHEAIAKFLSDLICSNKCLYEISSRYKTWLTELNAQRETGDNTRTTSAELSLEEMKDLGEKGLSEMSVSLIEKQRDDELRLAGAHYAVIQGFESFMRKMEQKQTGKDRKGGSRR